ncbi:hypothetical protein C9374_000039 [Naegleria lovaniensis]|uniref:Protein kinase domain-containing protein n=1 Tax=Naegleria lovaniensis TaxID=51637 RepID=A0AA88KM60_NAELO|nr:uncharacterized protein C9374_000039 [Naegleria lovaniensis]KAG2388600.1 hypothetical protein C9374_000039 [Naegleria lovaniensis]
MIPETHIEGSLGNSRNVRIEEIVPSLSSSSLKTTKAVADQKKGVPTYEEILVRWGLDHGHHSRNSSSGVLSKLCCFGGDREESEYHKDFPQPPVLPNRQDLMSLITVSGIAADSKEITILNKPYTINMEINEKDIVEKYIKLLPNQSISSFNLSSSSFSTPPKRTGSKKSVQDSHTKKATPVNSGKTLESNIMQGKSAKEDDIVIRSNTSPHSDFTSTPSMPVVPGTLGNETPQPTTPRGSVRPALMFNNEDLFFGGGEEEIDEDLQSYDFGSNDDSPRTKTRFYGVNMQAGESFSSLPSMRSPAQFEGMNVENLLATLDTDDSEIFGSNIKDIQADKESEKEKKRKALISIQLFRKVDEINKYLEKSTRSTKYVYKKTQKEMDNVLKINAIFTDWKLVLPSTMNYLYLITPFPEMNHYSVFNLSKFGKLLEIIGASKKFAEERIDLILYLFIELLTKLIAQNINIYVDVYNLMIWKNLKSKNDQFFIRVNPALDFSERQITIRTVRTMMNRLIVSLFDTKIKSIVKYDVNSPRQRQAHELVFVLPNPVDSQKDFFITMNLKDFPSKYMPVLLVLSEDYDTRAYNVLTYSKKLLNVLKSMKECRWFNNVLENKFEKTSLIEDPFNDYENIAHKSKPQLILLMKTNNIFPDQYSSKYITTPMDVRYKDINGKSKFLAKYYAAIDSRSVILENIEYSLINFLDIIDKRFIGRDRVQIYHIMLVLLQIIKGVCFLHSRSIAHLNLNPFTVLIQSDDTELISTELVRKHFSVKYCVKLCGLDWSIDCTNERGQTQCPVDLQSSFDVLDKYQNSCSSFRYVMLYNIFTEEGLSKVAGTSDRETLVKMQEIIPFIAPYVFFQKKLHFGCDYYSVAMLIYFCLFRRDTSNWLSNFSYYRKVNGFYNWEAFLLDMEHKRYDHCLPCRHDFQPELKPIKEMMMKLFSHYKEYRHQESSALKALFTDSLVDALGATARSILVQSVENGEFNPEKLSSPSMRKTTTSSLNVETTLTSSTEHTESRI